MIDNNNIFCRFQSITPQDAISKLIAPTWAMNWIAQTMRGFIAKMQEHHYSWE